MKVELKNISELKPAPYNARRSNEKQEVWKEIPSYEGYYQASNLGRIKSFRGGKEKIINGGINKNGYRMCILCVVKNRKTFDIHQLVAMAFLNHIPCKYKMVVDHKNANKLDNRVDNLQLITARENCSKDRKGGSSNFTGVHFSKEKNKWVSKIKINMKSEHLGYFINEIDAHLKYQNRLKEICS